MRLDYTTPKQLYIKHQSIHKSTKQLDLVILLDKMNKSDSISPICKDLENATYHSVNKTKQVSINSCAGDHSKSEPPDPFPNSEVKPLSADGSVGLPM